MTGENMLRAVSNEGILTLDGKNYSLGGLDGQPEFGYTQYKWLDRMEPFANSFRVIDFGFQKSPRVLTGKVDDGHWKKNGTRPANS